MILLSSVLVIGLSIMFVKNKQNDTTKPDTTSWNTYKSEIYKFEFKYPKPWVPVPYSPGRMTEEDVWLINKPEYISNINEYSYTKNEFFKYFY